MLNIYDNSTAEIILYGMSPTYTDPYYIFRFIESTGNELIGSLSESSDYPTKYKRFYVTDSSDFTFSDETGKFEVYESTVDASAIDSSMNFLTMDLYTFTPEEFDVWKEYNPSITANWKEYNPK